MGHGEGREVGLGKIIANRVNKEVGAGGGGVGSIAGTNRLSGSGVVGVGSVTMAS